MKRLNRERHRHKQVSPRSEGLARLGGRAAFGATVTVAFVYVLDWTSSR